LHPDDVLACRDEFTALLTQPAARTPLRARFKHRDGTWHHAEGVVTNLLHDPAIAGIVANFRDVTDRRLAEQRADEARELVEQLSADAVIVVDMRMRVVSWNRGAEHLFGWTAAEVIGKVLPVAPPELVAQHRRTNRDLAAGGQTITNETDRLTKSGERIPVLGSWSAIALPDGRMGVLS